jgi:D-glycero-alpha-D-manno-heptose-7-phosphate kinase
MIIAKAPFRISYVGGGTDFDDFYNLDYGAVISAAIDKAIHVTLIPKFDDKIYLRYSELECVDDVDDLKHDMVREALKLFSIEKGIEITIISDVPSRGTGLGSSSSLATALLAAFAKYKEHYIFGEHQLAEAACRLEIDILGRPIGRQDQYAAAFGGLNLITFNRCFNRVEKIPLDGPCVELLEESTLLFYLGNGRNADNILINHKNNINQNYEYLTQQLRLVKMLKTWLDRFDKTGIELVGEMVDTGWEIKKIITPDATNDLIEDAIARAKAAGACGAKVCGAGSAGFLMVICDTRNQDRVINGLNDLKHMEFAFEDRGADAQWI